MVADSDGQTLTAVVICEGNISDPDFPDRLNDIVGKLSSLITPEDEEGYDSDSSASSASSSATAGDEKAKSKRVKVAKVEPWNSVRVTLSIPKEAATKLRELASAGNNALRALGILSVQLEGDSVISLRLVGREIVLRTDGAPSTSNTQQSSSATSELAKIFQQQSSSNSGPIHDPVPGTSKVIPQQNGPLSAQQAAAVAVQQQQAIFKSPNTVCPMDGKLPVHVPTNLGAAENAAEYPFESMIQARVIQRRENTLGMSPASSPATTTSPNAAAGTSSSSQTFVQPAPPPPYPAKGVLGSPNAATNAGNNNIAISSPLLVNLLQNEGAGPSNGKQQVTPQDRVNSANISNSSGNGGNKCTVNNKGLMSKSTLVTSQQQQQQQVAGTHDKQAIVINNNLLLNKSPNSNELSNSPLQQQQQQHGVVVAQSSPVPLPTNANNAGQMRRQMSGNQISSLPMQQQQVRAQQLYFARAPNSNQQQFVVPNALRQQLPQQQPGMNATYGNVRWKMEQQQLDPDCQEFDRFQKMYNHSQQQQENTQGTADLPPSYGQQQASRSAVSQQQQQNADPLGLGNLADLADLTKNDLDSLLPSLHPHDLDSALLAFDTKGTSLDSLLDIDLISSLDTTTTTTPMSGNSAANHSQQLTNGPIVETNHISSSSSSNNSPQVQLKQQQQQPAAATRVTNENPPPQRFLINPLTGDMEITQVEDTSEQDANNVALVGADFHETYKSDGDADDYDDESSRGTNFSAKYLTSDMSDTEKSNQSGDMFLQAQAKTGAKKGGRTKKEKVLNPDGTVVKVVKEKPAKTRVSKVKKAVITPVPSPTGGANAELKLRLKLETSGSGTPTAKKPIASKPTAMVAQQYNFNASIAQQFMQQSQTTQQTATTAGNAVNSVGNVAPASAGEQSSTEEPRVPPLHISIKNKSVVIKSGASGHKKEKKRFLSQSGSESGDDATLRLKKKNSELLKMMNEEGDAKRSTTTHEISSPNGMLGPDGSKKRRLSTAAADTADNQSVVGSTNIGTIGSYSLINHLKEKSNLRTLLKTGSMTNSATNPVTTAQKVDASQEQPAQQTASPVKSIIVNSMTATTTTAPVASSKTTLKALLTHGSDSMINEEKFKQKLLENSEVADAGGGGITETSKASTDGTFQNNVATKECVKTTPSDTSTNAGTNMQRPVQSSPKRETIGSGGGVLIDPSLLQQNVRGSPGSQAQGEDSGIESMDALSEKSPHQNSHSPQGGTNENLLLSSRAPDATNAAANSAPSGVGNSTNNNKVSVSDMHSSVGGDAGAPDDYYEPNDIEAALANMEGIDEIVANEVSSYEKETKINGDHSAIVTSKSNLLADLGEPKEDKYEFHDSPQTQTLLRPSKDLNENKNEVITKDECCNVTPSGTAANPGTKPTIKKEEKPETIKDELLEPCPVRTTPALYTYSNSDKYRGDMNDTPDIKIETPSPSDKMLQQLSIEIPQNNENDNSTRIRTRASSKLESPLDSVGAKQSPQDSPAANLKATLSKLNAAAIDRLSPKGGNQVNKKRKRAGSESSNQSCVSDDLQTRTKKSKKTENDTSTAQNATPAKVAAKPVVNAVKAAVTNQKSAVIDGTPAKTVVGRTLKRSECSSDSDEPLIEIAGKVRNSKLNRSASSSTSSLTGDCEKVLRNHRVVNANNVQPQTPNKVATKAVAAPTTPVNSTIGGGEEKISTRRSVRMTSSALSTTAINQKAKIQQQNPGLQNVTNTPNKQGNGTLGAGVKEVAVEGTPEARRKTRSAGLDGTEGRRRRNSRDGK
ncbi:uncharacterized protein LOC134830397 isoform X2 [Culicoides brevitarsis]|uniref:uncharacterized protein LOC134830397 isoform X2 n=1 Tax=Culicoides brevitarsis TaxID=469753 RepID=UPI00307B47BD